MLAPFLNEVELIRGRTLKSSSDIDVENWPLCDVLISFFSTDFPLDKAVAYAKLRDVYCINDLMPQALLWDRRLVGQVLDHLGVPTPPRHEVSRDGGPKVDKELKEHMKKKVGVNLGGFQVTPEVSLREDGDAIIIDGKVLEKPFVEKPVSGEDHNVYIYFRGGGGCRLFRKVRDLHHLIYNQGVYGKPHRLGTSRANWTRRLTIREQMGLTSTKSSSAWTTWRTSRCILSVQSTRMRRRESLRSWMD